MAQANAHNSIRAPINSTRRRFLTISAAASVVSVGTLAAAAMPAPQAVADDSELLKLEELIFEQHEKATADDDEIYRLAEIWTVESHAYQEALAEEARTGVYLSPKSAGGSLLTCRNAESITGCASCRSRTTRRWTGS